MRFEVHTPELHSLAIQAGMSSEKVLTPDGEVVRLTQVSNPLEIEFVAVKSGAVTVEVVGRQSSSEVSAKEIYLSLDSANSDIGDNVIKLGGKLTKRIKRLQSLVPGTYSLKLAAQDHRPFVLSRVTITAA